MRVILALLLACLVAVTPMPISRGATSPRLMVVGDSISQGSPGDYTWRYWLWQHLSRAASPATLVGTRTDLHGGSHDYADPDFPQAHSASWGLALWQEKDRIADQVPAADATVLLVLLGVTDLAYGYWRDGAGPANLIAMVTNARGARADLAFVISELPPTCSASYSTALDGANQELRETATSLSTPESPVVVVAMDPTYEVDGDSYDCAHPNPHGEFKIARSFAAGLHALGIGSEMSEPDPQVPWPRPPAPTVGLSLRAASIRWAPIPGATCYFGYVAPAQGQTARSDCLTATELTVDRPASGTTSLTISAAKGRTEGPRSKPVAIPRIPSVAVTVARAGFGDKLFVDVNPDRRTGYWTFQVQRRTSAGSWSTSPTVHRTHGTAQTRTITLGPGVFRVTVAAKYGYQGRTSAAVTLTRPTVRATVAAVSRRDRLYVNVDPNKGTGYWTFRVQRRTAAGSWRTLPPVYRTLGAAETRTLNLSRGTYRVRVSSKYHYLGATSAAVTLAR